MIDGADIVALDQIMDGRDVGAVQMFEGARLHFRSARAHAEIGRHHLGRPVAGKQSRHQFGADLAEGAGNQNFAHASSV